MEWDKLRRARGVCCTSRQADRVAKVLPQLNVHPAGIVQPRKVNHLLEQQRRAHYQALGKSCPMPANVHHCDFRELLPKGIMQPGTVGLVLTDPPWGSEFLPLWSDLALFAEQALMDDGFLVAYLGTGEVPEKLAALGSRLEFMSLASLRYDRDKATHSYKGRVHLFNHCTYAAIFAKNAAPQRDANLVNALQGTGKEKSYHPWQQDLGIATRLIADLTTPADLIVDPFGGAFTFALAAARMGRRCISCDVDEKACDIARLRLSEALNSSCINGEGHPERK